jgi:hypothetical protein
MAFAWGLCLSTLGAGNPFRAKEQEWGRQRFPSLPICEDPCRLFLSAQGAVVKTFLVVNTEGTNIRSRRSSCVKIYFFFSIYKFM